MLYFPWAVSAANTGLADSNGLQMAQMVDAEGIRTIGKCKMRRKDKGRVGMGSLGRHLREVVGITGAWKVVSGLT